MYLLSAIDWEGVLNTIWNWITTEGLKVVIGGIILFVVFKLTNMVIRRLNKRLEKKNVDKTLRVVVLPWVGRIIKFIAFCVYIGYLGFETSSISAAIASLGVTVGLALQGSLSNLAAGIVILVTRPFRVGDKISSESATGIVENITIMYTYINTSTNELVCIPNSDLTSDKLINFTAKPTRRLDLNFGVAYTKDYKRAKDVIMGCVAENGKCLEDPAPAVVLAEQAASSLVFTLKVWTKTEDYDDVKADLMERVTDALIAANVEIPYNQLDVHIK